MFLSRDDATRFSGGFEHGVAIEWFDGVHVEQAHQRQPEAAARLMGFAQAHCSSVTGPLTAADFHDLRRVRRLCERLCDHPSDHPSVRPSVRPSGAADLARWWREGAALDVSQAVRLALHGQPGGRA